jgi:hypothetical protein
LGFVILSEHESAGAGEGESKDPESAAKYDTAGKSFSMTVSIWFPD